MFGRKKEKELNLDELPLAPYPEYVNPQKVENPPKNPQQRLVQGQFLNTRPKATGYILRMEGMKDGKEDVVAVTLVIRQKDAERFTFGKTLLIQ